MNDLMQPFTTLANANLKSLTNFAQSPATLETANDSVNKFFELVQQSFGRGATSDAYTALLRQLSDNYAAFVQEYSASLMRTVTHGQSFMTEQVQEASERFASAKVKQLRTK